MSISEIDAMPNNMNGFSVQERWGMWLIQINSLKIMPIVAFGLLKLINLGSCYHVFGPPKAWKSSTMLMSHVDFFPFCLMGPPHWSHQIVH